MVLLLQGESMMGLTVKASPAMDGGAADVIADAFC